MAWELEENEFSYVTAINEKPEPNQDVEVLAQFLGDGALGRLADIAVPKIEGHNKIKMAMVLSALSLCDVNQDVNRIAILLYGDEGTGKSKFLDWIRQSFDVPKLSHRTTGAGLSGNASVIGVLSTSPIVAVDEMDKMNTRDLDALLEAMSEGMIEIAQAPGYVRYPAPVRVIAACNNITGFRKELLDRFDFRIKLTHPGDETGKQIISRRLRGWNDKKTDPIEHFWIKLFLTLNNGRTPNLTHLNEIETLLYPLIGPGKSTRSYERIVRIALAIARLEMTDCDETHVQQALDLIYGLNNVYPEGR